MDGEQMQVRAVLKQKTCHIDQLCGYGQGL